MGAIEDLYKNFGVLADAGDKASDHPDAYQSILDATKGTSAEKKLACQFIPRFFKHFPSLAEAAIDAQLDLCEEEETPIRRMAIKSLPDFCQVSSEHIPRITDILTQLLQQEDATEVAIVQHGLELLINKNAELALGGIFSQISLGDDLVREKAISFLSHVTATGKSFSKDEKAGQFLLQEIKKVLSDVTGDEFTSFVLMLTKVKSVASNPQNLADLITEQANLDKPFQPSEPESLDRLITCTRQASSFFLKGASPTKYFDYLFKNVLPVLGKIITTESGDYKYEVLKLVAELSIYGTEENARQYTDVIYKKLLEYMPLPVDATLIEETEEDVIGKLNFSFVECLMYALHKLGKKNSEYFTKPESLDSMKDFRIRLTYFGRMVQIYIKQLKTVLNGKLKVQLEEPENKIKVMALSICSNLNVLVKDFLHNPPLYKSNVIVSWKSKSSPVQSNDETVEEKRKRAGIVPISLDNLPPKKVKSENRGKLYSVPSERKGIKMDDDYAGRRKSWSSKRNRGAGVSVSTVGGAGGRGGRGRYQWHKSVGSNDGQLKEHENFLFRS